ncbi:hypothetical protein ACFP3Q_10955 [Nocardioides sp. GCM10027113]|uniref:hypothetical protein n=1 Tax=unclassified Nocardioides TaxID=2615069 RepID=UPI0036202440
MGDEAFTDIVQVKRHPLRTAVIVAVALLVAAGAPALHWWTHPSVFGGLGDAHRLAPRPLDRAAVATAVTLPRTEGEAETVTIEDVQAVLSENSARARVTFRICHLGPGEDVIGTVHDPGRFCKDSETFEPGMSFRHGVAPDSDYLFAMITPTSPGVVHLEQVEITYQRGRDGLYQQGTQTIRVDRKVVAR